MIRTGYLRWEIEVDDDRSAADATAREVTLRPGRATGSSASRASATEAAAERFVRGEATYDAVLRTETRDGGRRRRDHPRRRPARLPLLRERPGPDASVLDGEAPARGERLRPRGRPRRPRSSPRWSSPAPPSGPATPGSSSGRSSASSRARAGPQPTREDEPMRLDAVRPTSRASPSWSPPSWSATWSSPRSSTSSAGSTA